MCRKVVDLKRLTCKILKIKFYYKDLKDRLFNRQNLTKVFIIFIVGYTSRVLINNMYDINVFKDYTNLISYIYYIVMAFFTMLVHEFVSYFDIVAIPCVNLFTFLRKGINNFILYVYRFFNSIPKNIYRMKIFKIST